MARRAALEGESPTPPELDQLSETAFNRFREFIYGRSGIWTPDNKLSLLTNRIRRRLRANGLDDFDEYYSFLSDPARQGEVEKFIDAITTNETFFFRTEAHFEWFSEDFIPHVQTQARAGERKQSLRIWSAGCATGAEPYSIAICLLENRFRLDGWVLDILATDISEGVLREAREGIFKPRLLEGVTESQLRRYFQSVDGDTSWMAGPQVKELVRFEHHNLLEPFREGPFDCVFIRNVLIYFDSESKRKVMRNLVDAMTPGAFLVVGPSEGVYDMTEGLERHSTLIYRKPIGGAL